VLLRKKWALAVGLLVVLGVSGWLLLPVALRHYVNGLKPGVRVDEAHLLSLRCVRLGGIHLDLPQVKGTLITAVACKDKTIKASGGTLQVDFKDVPPKEGSGGGYSIQAENLTVDVTYGKWLAHVENASLDPTKVCGKKSVVTHTQYGKAEAYDVCVDRKTKIVTADQLDVFPTKGVVIHGHEVGKSFWMREVRVDPHAEEVTAFDMQVGLYSFGGIKASRKSGLYVSSVSMSDKRLFEPTWPPMGMGPIQTAPVDLKAPFEGDSWVEIKGAKINFNLKEKRAWGEAPCQTWLEALPDTMREIPPIPEVKLQGYFGFNIQLEPDVKLRMRNTCKLAGPKPQFIKDLETKFTYTVYHPNGKTFTRECGPNTPEWVPLQMVNQNMATALTTTEDPGFFQHRGFIPQAIENSLRDNLKLGKFFRGGSTLSMQLAKNLWLQRKRTLGRKVQEAILTVALESSLPKDKILELYLNVVEFGPDLYGIGAASKELLHKEPMELSLTEALYLVLRLPAPNHSAPYEKMKGKIGTLLDNVAASGKVPTDLVEAEKSSLLEKPVLLDDD
jgi:hypothetical protein